MHCFSKINYQSNLSLKGHELKTMVSALMLYTYRCSFHALALALQEFQVLEVLLAIRIANQDGCSI
jgi:hypothetical protein